jgi:glycosyltransferase involved in cell wall biosynthesis
MALPASPQAMEVSITILMPVRDAAAYLPASLDSILAQTHEDWLLLVLDDGSTDASAQIVEAYAQRDARVCLHARHHQPRGIARSLDELLDGVETALVGRADADDLCLPERLLRQRRLLDEREDLAAVTCRVAPFPEEACTAGMRRYFDWQNGLATPEQIARDRFVETPVAHPSLLLRTNALRSVGGWRDVDWPEDWDLVLRLHEAGLQIGRVDEVLYRWRVHDLQATRVDQRYSPASFLRARAHYLAREIRSVHADRDVWLLGAGPVGKKLAAALAVEGTRVSGFVDVDVKKIGRTLGPRPHRWPVVSMQHLFGLTPRPLAVASVGLAGGRERVRAALVGAGWSEGRDFVVAA